ncbi:valine-tRNA ligase [Wolffia australiana]
MIGAQPRLFYPRFYCFAVFLACVIGGSFSFKVVTLESIQIFTTHEFIPGRPTVFFQCQGEKRTILPDVTQVNLLYTFKGEESWQPLTELPERKCRRCGLYERDFIKSPDVFDEWELCSSDFVDGKYIHFKENEFNATFSCPECRPLKDGPPSSVSESRAAGHRTSLVFIIIISVLVSMAVVAVSVIGYRWWLHRKRQQEQTRFLKLFAEVDDIEDELGLGTL